MREGIKRIKSPVAIVATAALIAFITKNWIGFEIPGWEEFISLVIGAGVAYGIWNNPTDEKKY